MIALMVHGHEDDPEHTPYEVADAAREVGYRTRAGRALLSTPIFSAALAKEIAAYRTGEHARSLRTIVKIRDEPGDNKAADRKVRLEASKTVLGEEGKRSNVSVSVNVAATPGYVIRVRDPAPNPVTIEGVANLPGRTE